MLLVLLLLVPQRVMSRRRMGAHGAGDEGVVGNTDAARAVLRVQQKLQVMVYCMCGCCAVLCCAVLCCAMTSQRAYV